MAKIHEIYGCNILAHVETPAFGVECEIESIKEIYGQLSAMWRITEDGSLRNYGHEFISKPLADDLARGAFRELHSKLVYRNPQEAFSERTSIHVHMNVQSMTEEQVRTLLLIYALFEPVFFDMVDDSRKHNIHCVPLTDTYLPSLYKHPLNALLSRWHKYTALNLIPVSHQGTVEFRHMHGHNSPSLFDEWLHILGNLDRLSRQVGTLSKDHISSSDWLDRAFRSLFFGTRVYEKHAKMFHKTCFNQIMDVKLAFI